MRIAVDIGGTFTDATIFDDKTGAVRFGKALTTPGQLVDGVLAAIERTGGRAAQADLIIHGSTVVINALLQRQGARAALITTPGFRDVYEIGRINRPQSFNLFFRKHVPLIPRDRIVEVAERMWADGTEELPLDEEGARLAVRRLAEQGVEAIAILFLHSYRSPQHEARMRDIVRQEAPQLFVTASHELSREYREYERTSTVAANAYVGPLVSQYMGILEHRLAEDGFGGGLMIMQSNGGLTDVATARAQCIQMMESGPAGGVVGSTRLCDELAIDNAICFDMGGTTAKACVVRRGAAELSPDYFVGGYDEGLAIRIPVLDIKEVGTGGGSVASVDVGGGLRVGPESAGAEPGPACYGRGGDRPTVTDADLVLGHLAADRFMGGALQLDAAAATRVITEHVAIPLGLSVMRAAAGIVAIAVASMANAVRAVTTERGFDPRDFTLIAYGGGGPLHAVAVARELAIKRVIVPPSPGHFSAYGMLQADVRRDYVLTSFSRLADLDLAELEGRFVQLETEGQAALREAGLLDEAVHFVRAADMRYIGQEHAVAVGFPPRLVDDSARAAIAAAFSAAHQERFSHSAPEQPTEIVSLRVSAVGMSERPALPRLASGTAMPPQVSCRPSRRITLPDEREVFCAVYDRALLLAGNEILGPAIVEEVASSTLVGAGDLARIGQLGEITIEVGAA